MESNIFKYSRENEANQFGRLIAAIDESEPYEVDMTEIYINDEDHTITLVTASGCSCWEGEYQTREFVTLEQLEKELRDPDINKYHYNPSIAGLQTLLEQAFNNLA